MATFIDGVNRLLRINNVIRGDDDAIAAFTETQHSADIQIAQIAIQSEISEIISDRLIPYEKASSTITLATGTRTYALESNFVRFFGSKPSFLDTTDNTRIYEYTGGEDKLMNVDYQYKTTQGSPMYWYWHNTTTKQIALYNVPSSSYNGRSWSYEYEKSVTVSDSTDTLPLHSTEEFHAFIDMASQRFRFLVTKQDLGLLTQDATYSNAKARLYNLIRPTNPVSYYGKRYG